MTGDVEMGAVAQCPNNWGVGSAFHPKKIHIFFCATLTWGKFYVSLDKKYANTVGDKYHV